MTQPQNPCKTMIFKAKKSEKNSKIGLPSSGIPVGWYHNLMNIELNLTMKGQTLC
jgi:hypothetical protein